ncbi:hypothetical protein KP509_29G015300 [Ceratopteris richardii]|uniref:Uncharacterized protein n=1 Tax=Ceratopteris richardii TaxID=49495 RepID=A0A8T2R5Y1_CERRI|nr:hypothetical protein KP509_29G015300 [Ceratopteris richardii]
MKSSSTISCSATRKKQMVASERFVLSLSLSQWNLHCLRDLLLRLVMPAFDIPLLYLSRSPFTWQCSSLSAVASDSHLCYSSFLSLCLSRNLRDSTLRVLRCYLQPEQRLIHFTNGGLGAQSESGAGVRLVCKHCYIG